MARFPWLAIPMLLAACGPPARETTTPPPAAAAPEIRLARPGSFATDFSIDQRVTAIHPAGEESFRAVLEKSGDSLVMVGLGPHGGRAFSLEQRGDAVTFESFLDRAVPFAPEFMLLDVQRTWLVGLPGAPLSDGEHVGTVGSDEVRESWSSGRLLERSFRAPDGGVVRVTYEGGLPPDPDGSAPTRVVLENSVLGYRLVIEEIVRRSLPPG